jgi:predicted amidohydrolase YtcJ
MLRGLMVPILLLSAGCASRPAVDRLFVNGVVHVGKSSKPAAVAVAEGRIVAVVDPAEVPSWRASAHEVVDLHGANVYPGFTECHGHLLGYGTALEEVDLRGAADYAEVVERVRRAAAQRPPGSWIEGRGWDQNRWPTKAFPDDRLLSTAVPDHPVAMFRVDGHALLVNAAALAAAGITRGTADPPGGRILRDDRGEPTGVLVDTATELVERVIPPMTEADIERRVLRAAQHLVAFGFTEVHDPGTSSETLAVLRRLAAEKRLPLRVYSMLLGSDDALLDAEFAAGPSVSPDAWLTVRSVKLYADGALGSRGALLSAPYSDEPDTKGLAVTSPERLADVVGRAARAGFQVCTHCIGDAAVTRVLDIYERIAGEAARTLRFRIEHSQIVRPEDVPRYAALGVIASVQTTHCTSDMPWAPARLGPERIAWAYRWRSFLDAGVHLALGSDVPVESPDPRLGVWAAVTRETTDGQPAGGWNPAERLTMDEAIEGYTSWAAYAAGEEAWRGAIAPGMAADLTVFDRALDGSAPRSALEAHVLRTVVGGRDAFVAKEPTR